MNIYHSYTDQELTALLQQGDRTAFTEIYNRYWKLMFKTAFNVSRNREDSLDVAQTVFSWVWEHRNKLNPATSLKAYLYTAIKYKIANLIRNGKYRETLFDDLEALDQRNYEAYELEIKELKNLIAQLIDELPDKCREVFILSRNENLSHKQIAERLSIAEKTVDAHISRALKQLRGPLSRMASLFLML